MREASLYIAMSGPRRKLNADTTTNSGLHDFVGERVLARYARPGVRAADLGAGLEPWAARLRRWM